MNVFPVNFKIKPRNITMVAICSMFAVEIVVGCSISTPSTPVIPETTSGFLSTLSPSATQTILEDLPTKVVATSTPALETAIVEETRTSISPTIKPTYDPLIAFTSTQDGYEAVYLIGPDGQGLKRLVYEPKISYRPKWSPNGRYLAFLGGEESFIYIYDFETAQTSFIDRPNVLAFAWSPDSEQIVFTINYVNATPVARQQISLYDIKKKQIVQQWERHGLPAYYKIKWSPTGNTLMIFFSERGFELIYFLDLLKNEFIPVDVGADTGVEVVDASWNDRGDKFASITYDWATYKSIVTINDFPQEGTSPQTIYTSDFLHYMNWSPHGNRIVFIEIQSERLSSILMYTLNTSQIERTISLETLMGNPIWAPDGKNLAFTLNPVDPSMKDQSLSIYSLESGEIKTLLSQNVLDNSIDWRP